MQNRGALLIGVFLISMCGLMLELMLTRFGSVLLYYHFAFLAISLALLGTALGGIGVYVMAERFPPQRVMAQASQFALGMALSSILVLVVLLSFPLPPNISIANAFTTQGVTLIAAIVAMALPFVFLGFCITIILKHGSADVGRLYFFDLVGAAAGCLLLIPLLNWLDGIAAVIWIGVLTMMSGLLFAWAGGHRRQLTLLAVGALVLIGFAFFNQQSHLLRIRYTKGLAETQPLFEKWNSLSRVAVFPLNRSARGGEATLAESAGGLNRMLIDIDAGASTFMTEFDGDFAKVDALKSEVASVAYRLTPKRNVLIIGAGGGNDVLTALLFGSQAVTAVEMNPLMLQIGEEFGDFNGHILQQPPVTTVVDEARSYIQHTDQQFDIIQATLVDTWAASAAGAFALTENYLYTQEAFRNYWDHLTDDGIFTMTRFYFDDPKEMLRLIALPLAVMDQAGVVDPSQHLVVVRREFLATILWKKTHFTADELRLIDEANAQYYFPLVYTPYQQPDPLFAQLITAPDRAAFYNTYASNIRPPTDNQPFFFFFNKSSTGNPLAALGAMLSGDDEPSALLAFLVVVLALFALAFLIGPLFLFGRQQERPPFFGKWLFYFACIGLGFIMVEIVLIQRFILFLGHPIYATSVILFSLLLFGGLGSFLTQRLQLESAAIRYGAPLIGLIVLLAIYNVLLPGFIRTTIFLSAPWRILLSAALICPLGLLMGMPFPLGIQRLDALGHEMIPWVWGINGAFSVLGSVFAAVLSINYGFATTMWIGLAAYVGALAAFTVRNYDKVAR